MANLPPITIRTNVAPPVVLDPGKKGAAGWLLKLIRPTLDTQLPVVGPFHYAPWGDAVDGLGTFAVYGLAGLAVLGAICVIRFVFKRR